jgi:hypothetical protein
MRRIIASSARDTGYGTDVVQSAVVVRALLTWAGNLGPRLRRLIKSELA